MHGNLNQIREDASINLNRCEKHNVISASHKKKTKETIERKAHTQQKLRRKKNGLRKQIVNDGKRGNKPSHD